MSAVLLVAVLAAAAVWVLPGPPGSPSPPSPPPPSRPGREGGQDRGRRRGTARGRPGGPPPVTRGEVGETARLLAAALRAGTGVVEALEVVGACAPDGVRATLASVAAAHRWGLPAQQAWDRADPVWDPVARALVASDDHGLSPVSALEAAARTLDRERRARVTAQVRRLEVLVVLPLGLAFLPGFVLTTVVPIVAALAGRVLR